MSRFEGKVSSQPYNDPTKMRLKRTNDRAILVLGKENVDLKRRERIHS